MEVLLFALFFISALVFFIAGKDDFGRTESRLIIKVVIKKYIFDKTFNYFFGSPMDIQIS